MIDMIKLVRITKIFSKQDGPVLDNICYEFVKGKLYLIKGISGSGKTTLFNLIGTLDKPDKPLSYEYSISGIIKDSIDMEHIKTKCRNVGLERLLKVQLEEVSTKDDLIKVLSDVIDDQKLLSKFHKYYARIIKSIYFRKFIEVEYGKNNEIINENERLRYLYLLSFILYPILDIDFQAKTITIRTNLEAKFLYRQLEVYCSDKKKNRDSIDIDENLETQLITYINTNLISSKSNTLLKIWKSLKFPVSQRYNHGIPNWLKVNILKRKYKERLNRILSDTLFYPLLTDTLNDTGVKYYSTEDEKAFYEWNFYSKTISPKLSNLRSNGIRTIYQDFRMIECISAIDNVLISNKSNEENYGKIYKMIMNIFCKNKPEEIKILEKVKELNNALTFKEVFSKARDEIRKGKKNVMVLSGGQKQLIGICRALGQLNTEGRVYLADEPAGQMDVDLKKQIYELLQSISKKNIVIIVTHDNVLEKKYLKSENVISLKLESGRLTEETGGQNV
ncbi:MAG: hypothetical protein K9N07_10220 [Candidatus Cloacimonetes bacterium]|nr:hypothetical protein [Candidatus Cloacimonadota bacterium]